MSRMSLDQFQQKKMPGTSSVSSVSRHGAKKGRFNEDFSQHHITQRSGSAVSGMHQNKLQKITKNLSKYQGENNLSPLHSHHSLSQNPSRNFQKRFLPNREENKSEQADSIKSKIIDAIAKMDEVEIQKLKSVLRIEDIQDNEMTQENLKRLDEINREEEDNGQLPQGGIQAIIPTEMDNQVQHAQGAQMEALPSIPPSDKPLSNLRGMHKAPSIRSKHPLSIRSGYSNRTQPSYISNLENQLNQERKKTPASQNNKIQPKNTRTPPPFTQNKAQISPAACLNSNHLQISGGPYTRNNIHSKIPSQQSTLPQYSQGALFSPRSYQQDDDDDDNDDDQSEVYSPQNNDNSSQQTCNNLISVNSKKSFRPGKLASIQTQRIQEEESENQFNEALSKVKINKQKANSVVNLSKPKDPSPFQLLNNQKSSKEIQNMTSAVTSAVKNKFKQFILERESCQQQSVKPPPPVPPVTTTTSTFLQRNMGELNPIIEQQASSTFNVIPTSSPAPTVKYYANQQLTLHLNLSGNKNISQRNNNNNQLKTNFQQHNMKASMLSSISSSAFQINDFPLSSTKKRDSQLEQQLSDTVKLDMCGSQYQGQQPTFLSEIRQDMGSPAPTQLQYEIKPDQHVIQSPTVDQQQKEVIKKNINCDMKNLVKFPKLPARQQARNALIKIQVKNNQIQKIPQSLINLGNLRVLQIDHNKLKELPRWIGKVSSLLRISASHNQIVSIPSEFPRGLQVLILNNNRISNISNKFAKSVPMLKELFLHDNELQTVPTSFCYMLNLNMFSLEWFLYLDPDLIRSHYSYIKKNVSKDPFKKAKEEDQKTQKQDGSSVNPTVRGKLSKITKEDQNSPTFQQGRSQIFRSFLNYLERMKNQQRKQNCHFYDFISSFTKIRASYLNRIRYFNKKATLLHQACALGHFPIVQNLVQCMPGGGFPINILDSDNSTPLVVALKRLEFKVAKYLLAQKDISLGIKSRKYGHPLHLALLHNQFEIALQILSQSLTLSSNNDGCGAHAPDADGSTPLHILFSKFNLSPQTNWQIAHKLVFECKSVNLNLKNKSNYTPFLLAVKKSQLHAVQFAIQYNSIMNQIYNMQKQGKGGVMILDAEDDAEQSKEKHPLIRTTLRASNISSTCSGRVFPSPSGISADFKDEPQRVFYRVYSLIGENGGKMCLELPKDLQEKAKYLLQSEFEAPMINEGTFTNKEIIFNLNEQGGSRKYSALHICVQHSTIHMIQTLLSKENKIDLFLRNHEFTEAKDLAIYNNIVYKLILKRQKEAIRVVIQRQQQVKINNEEEKSLWRIKNYSNYLSKHYGKNYINSSNASNIFKTAFPKNIYPNPNLRKKMDSKGKIIREFKYFAKENKLCNRCTLPDLEFIIYQKLGLTSIEQTIFTVHDIQNVRKTSEYSNLSSLNLKKGKISISSSTNSISYLEMISQPSTQSRQCQITANSSRISNKPIPKQNYPIKSPVIKSQQFKKRQLTSASTTTASKLLKTTHIQNSNILKKYNNNNNIESQENSNTFVQMENFSKFRSPPPYSKVFSKKQSSTKVLRVQSSKIVQPPQCETSPKKKQTDISFELHQREQSINHNIKPYQTSKPRITKTVLNAVSAGVSNALSGAIKQATITSDLDFSSPLDSKNQELRTGSKEQDSMFSPFRSAKNYASLGKFNNSGRNNEQKSKKKEVAFNTTSKFSKQYNTQKKKKNMLNLDEKQQITPQKPHSNLNVFIGSLNVNINLHLDSSSSAIDNQQKNAAINNILQDCVQGSYQKSYPTSSIPTKRKQTYEKNTQDPEYLTLQQFGQLIQSSRKEVNRNNKFSEDNQNISDVAQQTPIMKSSNFIMGQQQQQQHQQQQNKILSGNVSGDSSPRYQHRQQPMFSIDTVPLQQFSAQYQTNTKVPLQNKQPTPAKPSFIVNQTEKKAPPKSFIHTRYNSANGPFESMINSAVRKRKGSVHQSQVLVATQGAMKPPFYNFGGSSHNQSYSGCGNSNQQGTMKKSVIKQSFQEAMEQYSLQKNKYYHNYLVIMKQDSSENQTFGNEISDSQSRRYKLIFQLNQKAQIFEDKDAIAVLIQLLRDLPVFDKIRLEISHLISMLPEKQLRMCYDQIERSQNELKKVIQQSDQEKSGRITQQNTEDQRSSNLKFKNLTTINCPYPNEMNDVIEFKKRSYQETKSRSRQINRNRLKTLGDNQLMMASGTTTNFNMNINNTERSKLLQLDDEEYGDDTFAQKPTSLYKQQCFQFQNSMTNIQRYLDEKNQIRLRVENKKRQRQIYQNEQRNRVIRNLKDQITSKSAFKTFNNDSLANPKRRSQNRMTVASAQSTSTNLKYGIMMCDYASKKGRITQPIKQIKPRQVQISDQDVSASTSGRFTVRHMSNYFGNQQK